jgi:hypothetical protein
LEKIEEEIELIRDDIISFYYLPEKDALEHSTMKFLYDVWKEEYSRIDWEHNSWSEIQRNLNESVHPIKCIKVNSTSEDKFIDYRRYPSYRAIVIGGDALSRGLTLEGLMVSYFYRITKQYDTLLQMGRWFGYKDGFEEVCRIWTNPIIQSWYGYIGRVNEELKSDIDDMCALGNVTPLDYGLRVQEDVTGLIITSRAKMRTAEKSFVTMCLSGDVHDTMYVNIDKESILRNYKALDEFYDRVGKYSNFIQKEDHGNICWRDIPREEIVELLKNIIVPRRNVWYNFEDISKLINEDEKNWDIAIISRRKDIEGQNPKTLYKVHDMEIYCPRRSKFTYKPDKDPNIIQMGNRALKSPEDAKEFLSDEIIKEIRNRRGERSPSSKDFMISSRNPLLMIYYLDLRIDDKNSLDKPLYEKMLDDIQDLKPIGFALGFPAGAAGAKKKLIQYRANKIYQRVNEDDGY